MASRHRVQILTRAARGLCCFASAIGREGEQGIARVYAESMGWTVSELRNLAKDLRIRAAIAENEPPGEGDTT